MKQKIIQHYQKYFSHYDASSSIVKLIGERLFEKLEFIKLSPSMILDLGTGTGSFLPLLKKQYPKAKVIGADLSSAMLKQNKKNQGWFKKIPLTCADAEGLPFQSHSFDFIFMNAVLPQCQNLSLTFKEIARVLKPEGLLLFSSCGPDTLKELKAAWQQVDTFDHINALVDMHDIADVLLQEGFLDPVVDMEMLTVNYSSVKQLVKELKYSGSVKFGNNIQQSLSSKHLLTKLKECYPKIASHYPATIEIIYGHAWGKTLQYSQPAENGVVNVSIDRIRRR